MTINLAQSRRKQHPGNIALTCRAQYCYTTHHYLTTHSTENSQTFFRFKMEMCQFQYTFANYQSSSSIIYKSVTCKSQSRGGTK